MWEGKERKGGERVGGGAGSVDEMWSVKNALGV